jgi:ubiquinone/menaquinone biosynthesis C-methylase UbiE
MKDEYKKVVEANIAVHSTLAASYEKTEPHFRAENVAIVDARLREAVAQTNAKKLLDLGCGTGFMVNIAKKHVGHVVGVDVTRAMLDRVDTSGPSRVELHEHDTGSFPVEAGTFDVVTAYAFLHHLYDVEPTVATAAKALRTGGILYADLDPNFYFWEAIAQLEKQGKAARDACDPILQREIDAVAHRDDQIAAEYGIPNEVFNAAEYGKAVAGGFKEETLRATLLRVGFSKVEFRYYWFLGQAFLVNEEGVPRETRLANAATMDRVLQKSMPLARHLYKYVGFVATK